MCGPVGERWRQAPAPSVFGAPAAPWLPTQHRVCGEQVEVAMDSVVAEVRARLS